MEKLEYVIKALRFIDENYQEELNYKTVADEYNISQFYFHRIFTSIVGKTITEYIREKRLMAAAKNLCNSEQLIINICFECGFTSLQSFSRTFKNYFGVTPTEYRKKGRIPISISVEDMIKNFRDNTVGGINMKPRIIERDGLIIAGVSGDGRKTGEVWDTFENLMKDNQIQDKACKNYYEIRFNGDEIYDCHVGCSVKTDNNNSKYKKIKLPPSKYASFDIYVAKGYESSNAVIEKWLEDNKDTYIQRYYEDDVSYAIEYYDERFQGDSEESIVEIWIPIKDVN